MKIGKKNKIDEPLFLDNDLNQNNKNHTCGDASVKGISRSSGMVSSSSGSFDLIDDDLRT